MTPHAHLYLVFTRVPEITQDKKWADLLPWNLNPDEVNQAPYEDLQFY